MDSRLEPISPELVLVSPDLAARARALLPDRPWEAFLPPVTEDAAGLLPASLPGSASTPQRVNRTRDVSASSTRTIERGRRTPAPPAPWWRKSLPVVIGTALALALITGLSSLPVPDGPTLRPSASAGSQPEPQQPAESTGSGEPKPGRPFAGAGYVFGTDGRIVIAADGQSIASIEASSRCVPTILFRGIALARDGSFRAATEDTDAGTVVQIAGRVAAATTIRGVIRARSRGCTGQPRRFVARLS